MTLNLSPEEDEEVTAKNGLESYAYNLLNSIQDEVPKLEAAIRSTTDWLNNTQKASREEYESKQKELERAANLVMQKLSAAAGGA